MCVREVVRQPGPGLVLSAAYCLGYGRCLVIVVKELMNLMFGRGNEKIPLLFFLNIPDFLTIVSYFNSIELKLLVRDGQLILLIGLYYISDFLSFPRPRNK